MRKLDLGGTVADMRLQDHQKAQGDRLLQLGFLLFLLGLLVGFAIPVLANSRMGLASHLEGVMNGIFLIAVGLAWPKFRLSPKASTSLFWLAIYGTFANWMATLLAAFWGGGRSMPMAAEGHAGSPLQEGVIDALLVSLSLAMISVCILALWGLRNTRKGQDRNGTQE